jgi:predicted nucleic acid-binding protein
VVVDASALVKAMMAPPGDALRATTARQTVLHAPCLLDAEVVHSVRRLERLGRVRDAGGRAGLGYLRALPVRRHGMEELTSRMWQLRHNLGAYDAAYVALAEGLSLDLLTADRRLARAPGLRCEVIVA